MSCNDQPPSPNPFLYIPYIQGDCWVICYRTNNPGNGFWIEKSRFSVWIGTLFYFLNVTMLFLFRKSSFFKVNLRHRETVLFLFTSSF